MSASEKMTKIVSKRFLCVLAAGALASVLGSKCMLASTGGLPHPSELQQVVTKVEGVVKDKDGEPLIGVSVVRKGTTEGTITDVDGKYSLNLSGANTTLVFSYMGYRPQEVVANKSVINIVMEENSIVMNTVVVVGYGTQKKENLTGAVSSVNIEETLGSRPIADVGRGLQGAVAGLTVVVPSGEVGSDPTMKIRGQIGSIEGKNDPLILLDNVQIQSIQMVNPDDIESISVLKDAASSSIYGAKAAFGVILITSKRGSKTESMSVTYSSNFAWKNPFRKMEMAGIEGLEYTVDSQENRKTAMPAGGFWRVDRESLQKAKEWQEKYGSTVGPTDPILYNRDWYYNGTDKYGIRLYDPYDVMVKEWSPSQTHNLSVNGRSGKTAYNVGLGYLNQKGMMKPAQKDDFQRYNASVNVTSEISKLITVRAGALYSDRNKRYPTFGSETADPWLYVYRWSRLFPFGVEERGLPLRDPAYEGQNTIPANIQNKYSNINLGATFNITKDWDVQFDYTYVNEQEIKNSAMRVFNAGQTWYAPVPWNDADGNKIFVDDEGRVTTDGGVAAYMFPQTDYMANSGNSYVTRSSRVTDESVINAYSTYNLKLGSKKEHTFKFMGGLNRVAKKWTMHGITKNDLIDIDNPDFLYAIGEEKISSASNWESQIGFFGRVNYMFSDKYLLEANLRYDGSSKFPSHLQWRWFPSFSAGWIVTNEEFMKPLESVLSFTKLRGSWGTIGDQNVPNNLYYPTLKGSKTNWLDSGGSQSYMFGMPAPVSRDITWQDIETLNLGVDMRFLKDKLGVTFDWFQRKTLNMIVGSDALPATFGAKAPKGNYGNLRTRGWEIAVDYRHRFSNGLSVNAMATVFDATTYVTKGADYLLNPGDRKLSNEYSTGRRFGDVYGYVTDRLYQKEDFVYDPNTGEVLQTVIIIDGVAKTSNMLSGKNPIYQSKLEDGNQIILFGPGDVKFVDLNGDGYITEGTETVGNPGDKKVIGNTTPRYEYGLRLGADFKGFDFSVFFQGVAKRDIWGDGQLAIPGYSAKEGAMPLTFASNYWREDRTDAFYPRAWDLGGSKSGYSMQIQSRYLLDMSYLRIKNITVGYAIPENVLKKIYLTKARFYVSLENFFTIDNLNGLPIDPETVSGSSMFSTTEAGTNYNLGRTGTGAPTFKTASVGVQLSF